MTTRMRVGGVIMAMALASLGVAAAQYAEGHGSQRYRRQLPESIGDDGGGMRRRMLQCDTCPSLTQARATCSALSATELSTVRATLISNCATLGFSSSRCCQLQQSSQWATYAACVW